MGSRSSYPVAGQGMLSKAILKSTVSVNTEKVFQNSALLTAEVQLALCKQKACSC